MPSAAGVRVLRADRVDLLRPRADPRRRDHRPGRRGERLALAVPGQRPDRAGRAGGDRPAGARRGRQDGDPRLDLGAPLLGGGVLCLLFPLVSLEGGARLPRPAGPGTPAFLWGFVRWERRIRRTGVRRCSTWSLRRMPGYGDGLAVGPSTSPASPVSSWCSRSSSRRGSPVTAHRRAASHPVRAGLCRHRPDRRPARVRRGPAGHGDRADGDDDRGPRGRRCSFPGRDRATSGGSWFRPCARGRPRRRRGGRPQLHPQPRRGPAPHGRCSRRGAPDRPADRVGDRRGPADDGLPARPDASRGRPLQAALVTALVVLAVAMVMAVRDLRCASRIVSFHPEMQGTCAPEDLPAVRALATRSRSTKPYLV